MNNITELQTAVKAVEASLNAHNRGCNRARILEVAQECNPNGFVYASIIRACHDDAANRRMALNELLNDYTADLNAALPAQNGGQTVNTIKSDCKINAAERAVRAVEAAIQAERCGYDFRSVIIAAQNVVPELKDMNQIVQCIGTRGSNLHALEVLQAQFVKELEELTTPVKEEGPQVIYVVHYKNIDGIKRRINYSTIEKAQGAIGFMSSKRSNVVYTDIRLAKETLK